MRGIRGVSLFLSFPTASYCRPSDSSTFPVYISDASPETRPRYDDPFGRAGLTVTMALYHATHAVDIPNPST